MMSSLRTVAGALAATLGAQTLASFAIQSAAVYGPVVTIALGVAPERVGIFMVVSYGCAMVLAMLSPAVIARYGPLRALQFVVAGTGLALVCAASGTIAGVLVAAVLSGFANGFAGPVSSHILAERAPPGSLNLVFSIKQTGVPRGAALAGLVVPLLLLAFDWRVAMLAMASVFVIATLAFQPLRAEYDRGRDRSVRLTFGMALEQCRSAIALAWTGRALRALSILGAVLVGMQMIIVSFLVTYLHFSLGYALVAAGLIYATMQVAGITGRIVWGAVGDRLRGARGLLGGLGVGSGVAACVLAFMAPAWPVWTAYALAAGFGFTGVAWNGIYYAEVARCVRREDVSRATAGTMFFGFAGGITGPFLISTIAPLARSGEPPFALGFGVFGLVTIVTGLAIALRSSPGAADTPR